MFSHESWWQGVPIPAHSFFYHLGRGHSGYAVAGWISKRLLSVPLCPQLTNAFWKPVQTTLTFFFSLRIQKKNRTLENNVVLFLPCFSYVTEVQPAGSKHPLISWPMLCYLHVLLSDLCWIQGDWRMSHGISMICMRAKTRLQGERSYTVCIFNLRQMWRGK